MQQPIQQDHSKSSIAQRAIRERERQQRKSRMVVEELDEKKETLKVTWIKVNTYFGSIFSTLLPGTMAKLEPPEGCTFLDALDISLLLFKPASLYIRDEMLTVTTTTTHIKMRMKDFENLIKNGVEGSNRVALANSGYPENGWKRNAKAVLSSAYLGLENG
ncbi:hypothetical protein GIB67_005654 [Kingdonia uniflora]|uniref:Uncharacterized protein n=1 Tax=Kingdonia uniflora TaxID=39325 RepID=A0A7J7NIP7_9MAGN|nr:hypothetical protein GIB67_005654 [Kingdonia uniflora]